MRGMWQTLQRRYKNAKHYLESWREVIENGYPARRLTVIGVTGTDGKTTTCHLIYEMLKAGGIKVAMVSTVAGYIGHEEIDTGFHVTTPDAKFLQPFIKRVVEAGMTHLVLEATSHGLDQHRVLGCNFKIGVITNITHEHLDYHKTFERYRATKAKLIRRVKYAIINKDDPSTEWMKEHVLDTGKQIIIEYGKAKVGKISPTLAGDYNLYNIAAAMEVAKICKVTEEIMKKVVGDFSGVVGRRQEIELGQDFRAIVDFAHTPNALEVLLTQLRKEKKRGRIIVVFGCAGLRDDTKRPMMGEVAKRLADAVIITAEDPRTENIGDIYQQITQEKKGFVREDDRQKAIEKAVNMARKGDVVAVTGKGHEKSMCFGTVERPWSDVEGVKRAVGQRLISLRKVVKNR